MLRALSFQMVTLAVAGAIVLTAATLYVQGACALAG
ncbi:hypothetical protein BAC1_00461 [uncultured bacterium]|nr:hypothetical protein BAC1_00461 [uncultured bacterium]